MCDHKGFKALHYKCAVPNCRGNYKKNGIKVSMFSFPTDEAVRQKWLMSIHRKDFEVTKNSRVSFFLISLILWFYGCISHILKYH